MQHSGGGGRPRHQQAPLPHSGGGGLCLPAGLLGQRGGAVGRAVRVRPGAAGSHAPRPDGGGVYFPDAQEKDHAHHRPLRQGGAGGSGQCAQAGGGRLHPQALRQRGGAGPGGGPAAPVQAVLRRVRRGAGAHPRGSHPGSGQRDRHRRGEGRDPHRPGV